MQKVKAWWGFVVCPRQGADTARDNILLTLFA